MRITESKLRRIIRNVIKEGYLEVPDRVEEVNLDGVILEDLVVKYEDGADGGFESYISANCYLNFEKSSGGDESKSGRFEISHYSESMSLENIVMNIVDDIVDNGFFEEKSEEEIEEIEKKLESIIKEKFNFGIAQGFFWAGRRLSHNVKKW